MVQALLGQIPADMRAVALSCRETGIHVTFVVSKEGDELREEIEDIFAEYIAYQLKNFPISTEVIVNESEPAMNSLPPDDPIAVRLVYLRKE